MLGPGGIGKSSLARRALHAAAMPSPAAAFGSNCEDLSDLPAVLARVADQLGVPIDDAQDPVAQIGRRLGPERVLCVLDNAEHLLPELPSLLERLLAAAPALSLLVTSRVRLGHAGEHSLPLAGLAVPDEDSRDLEAAVAFDAVRLFEARATVAQRSFSLARHLGAVIDIVASVGGLPLAIELAAGWVRLLPAEEIALDLRRSLDLLERDPATPGTPARRARQRARRARTLVEPAGAARAQALAALTVFQGGFTRAAALAVARAPVAAAVVAGRQESARGGRRRPLRPASAGGRVRGRAAGARRRTRRRTGATARGALRAASGRTGRPRRHRPSAAGRRGRGGVRELPRGLASWPGPRRHRMARPGERRLAQLLRGARPRRRGIAHFQGAVELGPHGPGRQSLAADVRSALSRMHYLRGEHQTGLAIATSGAELAEQCGDRRAPAPASPTPAAAIRHRRSGAPPALASSARWRSAATTAWRSKSRPR
ncbi:MAG: hypothetical protein U1F25_12080 [Rubrivivax sp.]